MQTIPQSDATRLGVAISESMRRHLKAEAARLGKDMGTVVEEALEKFIGPAPEIPTEPSGKKKA